MKLYLVNKHPVNVVEYSSFLTTLTIKKRKPYSIGQLIDYFFKNNSVSSLNLKEGAIAFTTLDDAQSYIANEDLNRGTPMSCYSKYKSKIDYHGSGNYPFIYEIEIDSQEEGLSQAIYVRKNTLNDPDSSKTKLYIKGSSSYKDHKKSEDDIACYILKKNALNACNIISADLEGERFEINYVGYTGENESEFFKSKLNIILTEISQHHYKLHGGGVKRLTNGRTPYYSNASNEIDQVVREFLSTHQDQDISLTDYKNISKKISECLAGKKIVTNGFFGIGARDKSTVDLYNRIGTLLEIDYENTKSFTSDLPSSSSESINGSQINSK